MTSRTIDPVYVPFAVTTAAGVIPSAPLVTVLDVEHATLESIKVQIPPGHVGATGVRFTLANQQIVPWSNTVAWIIGDNLIDTFDVGAEVDTGLAVVTYNVGNFDHTHYLRLKLRLLEEQASSRPVSLLDTAALNGG